MTYEEALEWILDNYFDGTIEDYKAFIDGDEENKVMATAVDALEKQIPKKPCIEKTRFCDHINCPNCGKRLVHRDETGFFAGALNDYCFNCGQRLDWGE